MNSASRSLMTMLLSIAFPLWAATGGVTCSIKDGLTNTGLPQSAGSNVDDYNQPSLDLYRVSTSYLFTDPNVDTTAGGGGYTVTAWATDYVPKTVTNIMVSGGATTAVLFPLYRPVLSLAISPTSIAENGGSATGTITLKDGSNNTVTLRNNLTLSVSSNNVGRATVTQPAVITAGNSTTTFAISAVDNALQDGDATVTITVTAGTWGSTNGTMTVTDND
jgi:hypothetical protein